MKKLNYIKIKLIIVILLLSTTLMFSQATITRKAIIETGELISINAFKLLEKRSAKDLIASYSKILITNGLGKKVRIDSKSIELILKQTYELRGKEELIRVGQKISSLSDRNLSSIKGFLAEEIHHNELLKTEGIKNIQSSLKFKSSEYVQKRQQIFITENSLKKSNLYLHKLIEIDLIGMKNNSKFIIEVKNIDSNFSEARFLKYMSQIVKQKAFADQNGIKNVFWSNIGVGKLSTEQIKRMERIGVKVFQKGSTSPLVNAKINMNQIKMELSRL
ncbi:MAG: hypothetical protein GZ091_14120 [Paludibacter sp.]|nr:hypothetical protein [Paludibacter sp.]